MFISWKNRKQPFLAIDIVLTSFVIIGALITFAGYYHVSFFILFYFIAAINALRGTEKYVSKNKGYVGDYIIGVVCIIVAILLSNS
ncbi:hypothetical protein AM501_16190 [Aneurinibacillus migulanus]|uniref:Uncharacterized protein n=2 Tax=Aneurinibacillus migulanus TaxID=47500 RepID=A0A0D1XGT4_ANEMI|nr:hypothetical protein [Aneurinibacillus migulanus]KIV51488.1 hypothetical protein TS64_23945 [Aneurinibacillus migulanus]KIV54976.1 hypothetical protein TS65_17490 [Aneurinibacillus migulanus]KON94430.1 hypothetical protein AF333_01930 [Aneurinibacillus migulanus]KPD07267.1 hypothetical protein AM501_16190 [Aneurinibacillus migulanus]MCP1358171.1 hypothetical protein [Aneurinibacillus migulanus]